MLSADTERWPDRPEASGNSINKEMATHFQLGMLLLISSLNE